MQIKWVWVIKFRHLSNIMCICAAITCAQDGSSFAVLACLPESSEVAEAKETMLQSKDGAILLFKVGDPVPVAFVKNVRNHFISNISSSFAFLIQSTQLVRI